MPVVPLKPVDRVEILSVMDNSIDVLMGNTPVAKRHKRERDALAQAAAPRRAWGFDAGDHLRERQQGFFSFRYRRHSRWRAAQYGRAGNQRQRAPRRGLEPRPHRSYAGPDGIHQALRPTPSANRAAPRRLSQAQERSARRPRVRAFSAQQEGSRSRRCADYRGA